MIEATLTALLLAPALAPLAPAPPAADTLFPPARDAMAITSGPDGEKFTYYDLVSSYADATDQDMVMSEETESFLRDRVVGLKKAVQIPAEKVQHTFESLMLSAGFVVTPPQVPEVPIFSVLDLSGRERTVLRGNTVFLQPDEIEIAAAHPAVIFTVSLDLPNTDVRQLSNSMRTMIIDANTQQMLPAGNTNSLVLVGFGEQVAGLARTMKLIDAAAAREQMAAERRVEVVALKHAVAVDLAAICGLIFDAAQGPPKGPQPVPQHAGTPPRSRSLMIVPDARTNSLVLRGTAAELERVGNLVSQLDREAAK